MFPCLAEFFREHFSMFKTAELFWKFWRKRQIHRTFLYVPMQKQQDFFPGTFPNDRTILESFGTIRKIYGTFSYVPMLQMQNMFLIWAAQLTEMTK